MNELITLEEFLIKTQTDFAYPKAELSSLLTAITQAGKVMSSQLSKAGLTKKLEGKSGTINIHGEEQKKLDLYANNLFIKALKASNEVCGIGSEEEDQVMILENEDGRNGKYIVLIDPIDGSNNLEANVSVGSIFSIYRRKSPVGSIANTADFLQAGRQQIAAGYFLYSASTLFVFTVGNGVHGFTYDPATGIFFLSHANMKISETSNIYSINEGNHAYFSDSIKAYLDYCKSVDKASNRPYTGRYIGTTIADFHRTLIKGGIYLYPNSSLAPNGRIRLCYECNPMAFLIEQAGGKSTNGKQATLDIEPKDIHQRTAFYIGSKKMVEKLEEILIHRNLINK